MTDDEIIALYVAEMKFRNLLNGTILLRQRYLRKFSREVGFADATEQRIITWLGRDISAKTRSAWISTISSFYIFCLKGNDGKPIFSPDQDGMPFNPAASVSKPRLHPRHPRPMPSELLTKALDNADAKMKCWLLLGGLAGCRCMEIAGLQREDIRDSTMTLKLLGKGDKERFVPIHPDIFEALQQLPMPSAGPLWNETADSVSRKGNRYLHSLGIQPTMHTLRHFFATAVYRSCKDLRLTQELLGHSSPQTTAIYAAADQSAASGVVGGLSIGED